MHYLYQPRIGGEGEGFGDGASAETFKHEAFIGLDGVDRAAHLVGNLWYGVALR